MRMLGLLELKADGVPLDLECREMPQLRGLKIAFVVDPNGTRIELTEGLAGKSIHFQAAYGEPGFL